MSGYHIRPTGHSSRRTGANPLGRTSNSAATIRAASPGSAQILPEGGYRINGEDPAWQACVVEIILCRKTTVTNTVFHDYTVPGRALTRMYSTAGQNDSLLKLYSVIRANPEYARKSFNRMIPARRMPADISRVLYWYNFDGKTDSWSESSDLTSSNWNHDLIRSCQNGESPDEVGASPRIWVEFI